MFNTDALQQFCVGVQSVKTSVNITFRELSFLFCIEIMCPEKMKV